MILFLVDVFCKINLISFNFLFIFGVVLMIDKLVEVIDVFLVLLLYVFNDELCN